MSKSERDALLSKPVAGYSLYDGKSASDILRLFGGTSFQSRKLNRAYEIYQNMLKDDDCTIFLGLAGAMVPAGQGELIANLIRERMVDVIFSTGAQIYHDFYEVLGGAHYMGTEHADDDKLRELSIDRIYDTYGDDTAYQDLDNKIEYACTLLPEGHYSSWELIRHFYKVLSEGRKPKEGITRAAIETNTPLFIPTFHDSSLMFGIVKHFSKTGRRVTLDFTNDLMMHVNIHRQSKKLGAIFIGGGVPKNHIQQITPVREVVESKAGHMFDGITYGIQITTSDPRDGGLSGCTMSESKSWGKYSKKSQMVTVWGEATILFPLLTSGVYQEMEGLLKKRKKREFNLEKQFSTGAVAQPKRSARVAAVKV